MDLCVSGASFSYYSADGVFIKSDHRDAGHLHRFGGVHDMVCIKKIYRPIQHLLGLFTGGEKKTWQASGQDEFKWIEKRWQDLSLESRKLQQQLLRQTPHMKKSFCSISYRAIFTMTTRKASDFGWRRLAGTSAETCFMCLIYR